jgi:hypothetical protein
MAEYTEEYAHTRSIKNNDEYYDNSSIQRSNTVKKHGEEKIKKLCF